MEDLISKRELLERYGVPTFLFVNKMDLAGADKAALLAGLKAGLDEGGVDFTAPAAERDEAAALCGEDALERYLEQGSWTPNEYTRGLYYRDVE